MLQHVTPPLRVLPGAPVVAIGQGGPGSHLRGRHPRCPAELRQGPGHLCQPWRQRRPPRLHCQHLQYVMSTLKADEMGLGM